MSKFIGFEEDGKQHQPRRSKKGKDYRDRRREDFDKFEAVTRRKNRFDRNSAVDDTSNRRHRHHDYAAYDLEEYSEDI